MAVFTGSGRSGSAKIASKTRPGRRWSPPPGVQARRQGPARMPPRRFAGATGLSLCSRALEPRDELIQEFDGYHGGCGVGTGCRDVPGS